MSVYRALLMPVAVWGCAAVDKSDNIKTYTPSQLVSNISTLSNKQVRVVGYLKFGQDVRGLWDSEEEWRRAMSDRGPSGDLLWKRCVTFYYDKSLESRVNEMSNKTVVIEATVGTNREDKEGLDLWACNEINVTAFRIISVN